MSAFFRLFPSFKTHPPSVYSSKQFIDDQVHGAWGSGIGTPRSLPRKRYLGRLIPHKAAWIIIPGTGYETSSGGPFFRYFPPPVISASE